LKNRKKVINEKYNYNYAFSPVQESVTPVEGAGVWLKSEAVRPLEVKVQQNLRFRTVHP
jgi:hypothetical protein